MNRAHSAIERRLKPSRLLRMDMLRSCKTGEVIEPTPRLLAYKLRIVGLGLLLGAPVVLATQWFLKSWSPRYHGELDALSTIDPVLAARKTAEFISLLFVAPVFIGIVVGMGAMIYASRVLRAGRWPMPGARVRRRTEVVAGWWCVRVPTLMLSAAYLATMLCAWSAYVQFETLFWNNYLDKRVEIGSETRRVTATKSAHAPGSIEAGLIGNGVRQ